MRDTKVHTGVLVTRGDVPVEETLQSWPFPRKIVWDNSHGHDLKVYGRWAACDRLDGYVYFQDDDCIVNVLALLDAWGGVRSVLNIPPDEKPLVGWGAIIAVQPAKRALSRYLNEPGNYPFDETFLRCADVIVTASVPFETVDVGHRDLPWATEDDRMYRQAGHYEERELMRERCRRLSS